MTPEEWFLAHEEACALLAEVGAHRYGIEVRVDGEGAFCKDVGCATWRDLQGEVGRLFALHDYAGALHHERALDRSRLRVFVGMNDAERARVPRVLRDRVASLQSFFEAVGPELDLEPELVEVLGHPGTLGVTHIGLDLLEPTGVIRLAVAVVGRALPELVRVLCGAPQSETARDFLQASQLERFFWQLEIDAGTSRGPGLTLSADARKLDRELLPRLVAGGALPPELLTLPEFEERLGHLTWGVGETKLDRVSAYLNDWPTVDTAKECTANRA